MVIQQFNRLIKNKWIWGVFAVAISGFFAFDFLFTGDNGGRSSSSVGTLEGKDVSSVEFSNLQSEARFIGRNRDNRSSYEINQQVWQTYAALSVAKALHMEATDDDVREDINHDPSFLDGGAFNFAKYENILRQAGLTPEGYEAFRKHELTKSKLTRVVLSAATWVSPMELDNAINDETDEFTVRVAEFKDTNFNKITVDDKAIADYYVAHTNDYVLPDCVKVRFVKIKADVPARLANIQVSEDELQEHYDVTSSRFETNGVPRAFADVKSIVEKDLKVIKSVEACRTNILFRVYAQGEKADSADGKKVDRLAQIAQEEKAQIQVSKRFSLQGSYVKGFMVRASDIAPDVNDFASEVAGLDYESDDLRYGVVAGSNAVYLVSLAGPVEKSHLPPFAEAKEIVRPKALEDARAKAFKAVVEKSRALVAADLAAGKPFDPKKLSSNVSTSIVFSAGNMVGGSFKDSAYVVDAAKKLSKGQISDFIPTRENNRRALVVYVENREPAKDRSQIEFRRSMLREQLSWLSANSLPQAWSKWNLDRLGYTTTSSSSVEAPNEDTIPEE